MRNLSNRWFSVAALCVISLGSACSGGSDEAGGQSTADVAVKSTKIVYYAIPD